jgi:thioredoxin 1
MHSRPSRLGTLVALMFIAIVLTGCGKEAEEEAARPPEGSPSGEAVVEQTETAPETPVAAGEDGAGAQGSASLPRLVDLGKNTCIPCKMMAPILEELKQEYKGRAVVEVLDLRENSQAGADYAIRVIPTQIFFDSAGEEVWRHEGFLPKDQIIAKFAEMGVPPLDD